MSTTDSDVSSDSDPFQWVSAKKPSSEFDVKMGEAEDVFENSACDSDITERDDVGSAASTARSSLCSSREDLDAAWAKLPNGTKDFFKQAAEVLYIERYESFVRNNWPYDVRRGNLCHPRALALAGLQFNSMESSPSAKCLMCHSVLDDLQANSNPWILHSETSPDCYFIKLGQRDEVDDYTMDQTMEMIFIHISNEADIKVKERETVLKKQLFALREHEKTLGVTDENH